MTGFDPALRCGRLSMLLLSMVVITMTACASPTFPVDFDGTLARIRLYNPTECDGPMAVEVPTGRIATPGLLDWDAVKLVSEGKEVPFAIREGQPHWRAELVAPVVKPNAEDLLVFSCAVPAGNWKQIELVPGSPKRHSALSRESGKVIVTYSALSVTVDEATGLLEQLTSSGEDVLAEALLAEYSTGEGEGSTRLAPTVSLASSSSRAAMTELNFVLRVDAALSIAITYRIHACGMIEIWSDERPWRGRSPWLDHSARYSLQALGDGEPLTYLVNRPPVYGFKDYEKIVKTPAVIHRGTFGAVVELGEEFTNGRRWNRRLYLAGPGDAAQADSLAELADEGYVVEVEPVGVDWPGEVEDVTSIVIDPDAAGSRVAAEELEKAMAQVGMAAETRTTLPDEAARSRGGIALVVAPEAGSSGIEGDGFAITPYEVRARTGFGLLQGVLRLAESLGDGCDSTRFPLVAANPAVRMRAGGFGGGPFQVDFPYGSEVEWRHALDGMISSGMNVMVDLGMWSNWKMPVSYEYMPELRSDSPNARDELTGAMFSEIDQHREHGQRILKYLSDRGVTVWEWLPIGCAPSTFYDRFPEAESPRKGEPTWLGSGKVPCHTHPRYLEYLKALLREKTETYSLGGFVMIRDDNGGICDCPRCEAALADSRTGSAVWEQYLIIYDIVRSMGFAGDMAVYPYNDLYEPRLDPLVPEDLLIVGHGSANALLLRQYERVSPMGDTWLNNLFASYRKAPSPRMKRLLADRPSFWIGGAYCGAELPWESPGYFGAEPTATPNSLRYQWGERAFGKNNALAYLHMSDEYEHLWDINDLPMHPYHWVKLDATEQQSASEDGWRTLDRFRQQVDELERAVADESQAKWFGHVKLFGTYFEYHLRRLENMSAMSDLVRSHRDVPGTDARLPDDVRGELIALNREVYALSDRLDAEAAAVPGDMLAQTRGCGMTRPFKEWVGGYDALLDRQLDIPQFAGRIGVAPTALVAGKPFKLRVELRNEGVIPWIPRAGHRIELGGDVERLSLPEVWSYEGEPMAFADRRTIELAGRAPEEPGEAEIKLEFIAPFRNRHAFATSSVELAWQ